GLVFSYKVFKAWYARPVTGKVGAVPHIECTEAGAPVRKPLERAPSVMKNCVPAKAVSFFLASHPAASLIASCSSAIITMMVGIGDSAAILVSSVLIAVTAS